MHVPRTAAFTAAFAIGGAFGHLLPPHYPHGPKWENPINDGFYADPDGIRFGHTFWVYATQSVTFENQTGFDAFWSKNLGHWTLEREVFRGSTSSHWANDSFWAPCVVERYGKYWMYYTANNPVAAEKLSGIGVASAKHPGGPFVDVIDHPMLDSQVNGANPMDQQVFIDDDGKWYLIWGGTYAQIAPLNHDMVTLGKWPNGAGPIDITPNKGFTEGAYMLKRRGIYYLMWSEGGYGTPDYRVAYAMSTHITGPFERIGVILSKDKVIADGPGHHSVMKDTRGHYYIVYHRRTIGDDVPDHRRVAIDRMEFNGDGTIKPVVMT